MIVFVRHGETDENHAGLLLGHADPDLNETGRAQARRLAIALDGVDPIAIVTSPLARTRETAAAIGEQLNHPVEIDTRLIDPAAATGARTVAITTGNEVAALGNGFTVTASTPVALSVNPNSGQQGQQNLSVTLTGQSSHFLQGASQANFGAGVSVSSLTVNSPTSATGILNVDPAAAMGARTTTSTMFGVRRITSCTAGRSLG